MPPCSRHCWHLVAAFTPVSVPAASATNCAPAGAQCRYFCDRNMWGDHSFQHCPDKKCLLFVCVTKELVVPRHSRPVVGVVEGVTPMSECWSAWWASSCSLSIVGGSSSGQVCSLCRQELHSDTRRTQRSVPAVRRSTLKHMPADQRWKQQVAHIGSPCGDVWECSGIRTWLLADSKTKNRNKTKHLGKFVINYLKGWSAWGADRERTSQSRNNTERGVC